MSADQLKSVEGHLASALETVRAMLAQAEHPASPETPHAPQPVPDHPAPPEHPAEPAPAPEAPAHEPAEGAPAHTPAPPHEPAPEPAPHDPVPTPDPVPVPDPVPQPVPTPPVGGTTVAVNETDLRDKIDARKGMAGDFTIGIVDGHFGDLTIAGVNTGGKLTVIAENRRKTLFETIRIDNSRGLRLEGVGTCPRGNPTLDPRGFKTYGLTANPNTSAIEVVDGVFRGHLDSANHARWTVDEWSSRALGAVFLQGPGSLIERCYAEGVNFGFNLTGDGSAIRFAYVFGASGDAFRTAADGLIAEDLLGTDLIYKGDDNHPDLIQGFKGLGGSSIRGVNGFRGRRIAGIEWTVRSDNPLRWNPKLNRWGIMQGFGYHATDHRDLDIDELWIRTPVANGVNIGGVTNLRGRRWNILSSDYGLPGFDTRNPKIRGSASGTVDVADTVAEAYAVNYTITNRQDADAAAYAAPEPDWIAPIRALAV